MTIQNSAQIANVIRDAVAFNPRNWPAGSVNTDALLQAVQSLFDLLEKRRIAYVLVGGIALLHYVEGRNTQDLDLLMASTSVAQLPELRILSSDLYFARADYDGLQIDILLTQNPLFVHVQREHSRIQHFLDRDIPIATVEGLLLLKLYALPSLYRQGNFARVGLYEHDIATLLHDYRVDATSLMAELAHYVDGGDSAKIEGILAEVQQRIQRFEAGQGLEPYDRQICGYGELGATG